MRKRDRFVARRSAMLVLSRRVGERISIGDGIVLTMVEVDGRQVRLGIEAPADVAILRRELVGVRRSGPVRSGNMRPGAAEGADAQGNG